MWWSRWQFHICRRSTGQSFRVLKGLTPETSLLYTEGETDFVQKNTSINSPFEGVEVYSHKLERGNKETDELIKLINEWEFGPSGRVEDRK